MSQPSGSGGPVFPLPLISPPPPLATRSRRCAQRHSRAVATTATANSAITAVNLLSTSFSTSATQSLFSRASTSSAHSPPPSSAQSRALAHIYRCASRFVCRRGLHRPVCDDPLSDIRFLTDHLQHSDLDAYISRPLASVVPVVADRISLPSAAGSVDLLSLLPPSVAASYAAPDSLILPPPDRTPAPRTRLFGSSSEWVKLVRRLYTLGMVDFTTSPAVVCGVFAVPKDKDSDRLIIDARPANTVFAKPDPVKLPTPDLLARLSTDGSRPFFVAKVDLDNFYHRLRLPVWMRSYFGLPPVRAGDVCDAVASRFGADSTVYPCCVTLPMGWSHSVLVAQLAHEHLLDTRTGLGPADRITHSSSTAVDRLRHQVYIDDLNLIGPDRNSVLAAQRQYIQAAESVGLVAKPSKIIAPSSAGVECLGLEVNGSTHTVGLPASELERLRADTSRLLSTRHCTGLELSILVGRWTWACLAARPALSVFSTVYRFIQAAGHRRFAIWHSVSLELRVMSGLAPLLFASTAAPWFERLIATDASSTGLGVVASSSPPVLPHPTVTTPEQAAVVAGSSRWHTIVSSRWLRAEHINVLELRALCTAVRWVLSFRHSVGCRLLLFSDSTVTVGAVSKGRSSSLPLNRRLRYLASLVFAFGLSVAVRWLPSELNPADGPSRL